MLLHLVFVGFTAMAVWFGARWVRREVDRVDTQMARLDRAMAMAQISRIPTLQFNPATGVYQTISSHGIGAKLLR